MVVLCDPVETQILGRLLSIRFHYENVGSPFGAKSTCKASGCMGWAFERLDTLRHRVIQRAGRLTRPQGELTLTMSAKKSVRKDLMHFLDVLKKAA